MFTGIITDIGTITGLEKSEGVIKLKITCDYQADSIDIGASIACAGICLTVIEKGQEDDVCWFSAEASNETANLTTLDTWREGMGINLERALKIGDELGGHMVSGHIDATAKILSKIADGSSIRFVLEAPKNLAGFIAPKGSVTLDGVSLTVNEVDGVAFGVNIIPHTAQVTTWANRAPGDHMNLEIDLMARYAARLAQWDKQE